MSVTARTAPTVAVIVPCFDEEVAVGTVVRDLRAALPEATVYVYDNNSTDRTAEVARAAGAVVRTERLPGKGNVVRRAFADVEADVYLMIDGDSTYDAAAAPALVEALLAGPCDMVVGARVPEEAEAYRPGHELGNRAFNLLVSQVFGDTVTDMLSGFRAFSRRFAKTFPAASTRFAIETELTVHAINHRMPVVEVPVGFRDRPEGSESKLSTISDGLDILRTIVGLLHHERPLWLYPGLAAVLAGAGLLSAGSGLGLLLTSLAAALVVSGMVLQSAGRGRREQLRTSYLRHPAPPHVDDRPAPAAAPANAVEALVREAEAVTEVAAEVVADLVADAGPGEVVPVPAAVADAVEEAHEQDDADLEEDDAEHRVIQLVQRPQRVESPLAEKA